MREEDKLSELLKERAYLSAQLEEATKGLARLDLLNLTLTQQKRQAIAAFNFIKVMHEKIEKALTIDDLYLNVVKALTSDLFMDSSALLRINFKTKEISIIASSGLPENLKCLKLDENISKQQILEPTFVNSKSSLQTFHKFVRNSFKLPYLFWHPIADEWDGALVLFVGNRTEDLMSKQPFSEISLKTLGAISSVILLRRDNIARTQEILRRKRGRIDFLAEILGTSPVSVIATDLDRKITYANPAMEKLYGYKAEELMGKDPGMLNGEDNADDIQKEIVDTVRGGKVWRGEILNKKKNDDLFYIHASVYPVLDREGNFLAFVGFQEDITKRKQAEKALQESEKKYRDLVNNALVGIYKTNLKGDILYVNEVLSRMLEFESPEEMMAEGASTRYKNPKDREVLIKNLRKRNRVESFEVELLTKTGKTKYVLLSAVLARDIILGMIMDITKRKLAEKALQEAQRSLEAVVETAPSLIVLADPDGRIILFNRACEEVTGYKRQEVLGRTISELFLPPEWIPVVQKRFADLYAPEVLMPHENPWVTKSGEERLIEWRCTILPSIEDGRPYILGTGIDITERKQAEEALRASKELFEKIFISQQDAIFLLDSAIPPTIIDCNPGATKIFGYTRHEMVGNTTDFLHIDDASLKKFQGYLCAAIDECGFLYLDEFRMKRKDGTVFPSEHSVIPLKDEQGKRIGWVSVVRDITDRKQAKEQLQSLSRRLVEVQEAERRLLASELHDQIGQNLTALSINLNIIRSQFSDEFDKKIKDRLEDSLKLVEETIERIRDVMAGLRSPVLDDYGLVIAMRWYSERLSKRAGLAIMFQGEEFSPRLPLVVETAIFRIFQEVLTNVAKHAQARQVNVALKEVDGKVQLDITDDGVGFDPAGIQRLKERPKWGLITTGERAKALGGHLHVESVPGRGTRVIVEVPR